MSSKVVSSSLRVEERDELGGVHGVDELMPRWHAELEAHGWTVDQRDDRRRRHWLNQHPDRARRIHQLERELLHIDDPNRARLLDHLDQRATAGRLERGSEPPGRGALGL